MGVKNEFSPVLVLDQSGLVPTANLRTGTDGWTIAEETWTYVSGTTFTVPGDQTARYQQGMRVKLTQTTVKYFVVNAASTFGAGVTTVHIYAGTDYTLANAAITSPYYSYAADPAGYPGFFTCTGDIGHTGFSAAPTFSARFAIVGRICTFAYTYAGNGTSNATGFTITGLPVSTALSHINRGPLNGANNNVNIQTISLDLSGTTLTLSKAVGGGGSDWTASVAKAVYSFEISYPF